MARAVTTDGGVQGGRSDAQQARDDFLQHQEGRERDRAAPVGRRVRGGHRVWRPRATREGSRDCRVQARHHHHGGVHRRRREGDRRHRRGGRDQLRLPTRCV